MQEEAHFFVRPLRRQTYLVAQECMKSIYILRIYIEKEGKKSLIWGEKEA